MRLSRVKLNQFRRFSDLEINGLSDQHRLVVLAGPNGSGKSSFFDALSVWHQLNSGRGWAGDLDYYIKSKEIQIRNDIYGRVSIDVHPGSTAARKNAFYFRTAYRNDPEFMLGSLSRQGPLEDEIRFRRMIEGDAAVSQNFQRLASQAMQDIFSTAAGSTTIDEFRESVIGDIKRSVLKLFSDLELNSLGNPLDNGTFRFTKGVAREFEYKNLSGGEKAAFDLILDVVVKRGTYADAVYCIDEPEAHMSTKLQGKLLEVLYELIPEGSQLWVATHSIGMMRKARELFGATPDRIAFVDFTDQDFDQPVVLHPTKPTRSFWENVLKVALDDLAHLVAPHEVIICEGNPAGAVPGKNTEHDAICLNTIFEDEFPDTKFIAGGNSHDVAADRLGFVAALPKIASAIKVRRLIDMDDHATADVDALKVKGISVLGRRHLESYLYDDEVLTALCHAVGKPAEATALLNEKRAAMVEVQTQGKPHDDVKSAAGLIYTCAKQRLALTQVGNDHRAFARNALAPLMRPGMQVYAELKAAVFTP
jgi:predicted ATPase